MLVLQDKITSLIERGAYNEAAQLFCNETDTKIYTYFKGWEVNKLWKENFSRPKYTVIIKRRDRKFQITFWSGVNNREITKYDILTVLQKYDCFDYDTFCSDYGLEKYNANYTDYNKQSRKVWKLSYKEYENVLNLFSDVMDELREII